METLTKTKEKAVDLSNVAVEMAKLHSASQTDGSLRYGKDGKFEYALAPNGERSKLSEQHWLLVRTHAFKDWFGDWQTNPEEASKIIDSNGEPLLLWHESPEEKDFEHFDEGAMGTTNDTGYYGRGFYFFSGRNVGSLGFYGGKTAMEYACFANVRNLFRNDTPELAEMLKELYGNPDRETAIERGFRIIEQYKLGYTLEDVAQMYDEANATQGRFIGYQYDVEHKNPLNHGKCEVIVRDPANIFIADKFYEDGRHISNIPGLEADK